MNFQASIKTFDKQINNDLKNLSNWLNANKIALNPVDKGRKLNAHKTFRRRPGLLLNVLCTFSLRPLSTGNESKTELVKFNPPKKTTRWAKIKA